MTTFENDPIAATLYHHLNDGIAGKPVAGPDDIAIIARNLADAVRMALLVSDQHIVRGVDLHNLRVEAELGRGEYDCADCSVRIGYVVHGEDPSFSRCPKGCTPEPAGLLREYADLVDAGPS